MDDILKVLKSLVNDIEAMQRSPEEEPAIFGPFSNTGIDDNDYGTVEWQNLAISLQHAKEVLAVRAAEYNKAEDERIEAILHEYAFDVELKSVVRVKAHTENRARDLLNDVHVIEVDGKEAHEEHCPAPDGFGCRCGEEPTPDEPWAKPRATLVLRKRDKAEPTYQLEPNIDAWVEWAIKSTKENAPPK